MYEHHFGFERAPFRITPDPEFFFPGGNRGAVLEAMLYAIQRGEGMVKVVGEVGSGKTMLCRMLERELPDDVIVVYLANPRLSAHEILHAIAFELKLGDLADRPRLEVLHALHDFLLARHAENRRVVMFVEEAQAMPLDALEEIRMLSNLETTREKLLQIVLFGQPELDQTLATHAIRQLRERITHAFELTPFDRADVRAYLETRVRASGYRGAPVQCRGGRPSTPLAGLLRRINLLADKALLAAFAAQASVAAPPMRRAVADSVAPRLPWLGLVDGGPAGVGRGRGRRRPGGSRTENPRRYRRRRRPDPAVAAAPMLDTVPPAPRASAGPRLPTVSTRDGRRVRTPDRAWAYRRQPGTMGRTPPGDPGGGLENKDKFFKY